MLAALLLTLAADPASFDGLTTVTAAFDPPAAKPGQIVTFRLTMAPKLGTWTYPANAPPGQVGKNILRRPPAGPVAFVGDPVDPPDPKSKSNGEGGLDLYYPGPGSFTWSWTCVVDPKAKPGEVQVPLAGARLQVCNEKNCYYSARTSPPVATLTVLDGPAEPLRAEHAALFAEGVKTLTPAGPRSTPPPDAPKEPVPVAPAGDLDGVLKRLSSTGSAVPQNTGLVAFLLTAAAWGIISLLTPCVFPMVPITVSLFLKQAKQSNREAVKLSLVYALTIIAVLGVSAVALLSVFRKLSVDPYMNIGLGALFVVFALSLFGMYDIALPGFLLRFTEKRRAGGGYIGTVFGALAFSIVSFTCVAPFLGGFAGMAASGQFSQGELVLGGLAFATAFAAPFFLLSLFPSLMKKLPKSGGWLDTVKAVMGFLELAAALKFFRTAELRLLTPTQYFTYDVVLAGWVVVAAVLGVYLLRFIRLPHDEPEPHVGVPRFLWALVFLGLAVYLAPGLIGKRPGGVVFAWVDSFLLPEAGEGSHGELNWSRDLSAALATGQPVFVDITGKTCTNCRLNENDVFPKPDVQTLLKKYKLVSLYTDEVPGNLYPNPLPLAVREKEAEANVDFQFKAFGTIQLPLYAILHQQADGAVKVVGVYDEGKINDVPGFVEFLRKGLE